MRVINFISLVTLLTLTILVNVSKAETATSGNLLPNAGDGRSNPQKTTSTLDNTNVNSGFTLDSGITAWQNELEAEGTGTVSATGSLENITTTTQSGNSHTTTTTSLDGGVTLNSSTEVQNCEHSSSAYRCGNDWVGVDSYSTTLKILDENNNVLASTSITRNNDAGYYNSTYTYTDTVTHNDTGARKWDWQWQGIDSQSPTTTGALGPNLLGASLTATLLDITYQPAPLLTSSQEAEITNATGLVEDAIEDIKFEEIENIKIEEVKLEEIKFEEIKFEEIKLEEFEEVFTTNFKQVLIEENLVKEFETALFEENITEEEFFEEATTMIMEEFKEPMKIEEGPSGKLTEEIKEEEIIEEKPTEELTEKEETNAINEEPTNETVKTEEAVPSNEETTEPEGQESEVVSNESDVAEDKETEGQEKETSDSKDVEGETDVSVKDRKVASTDIDSIGKKVEKIIAKLNEKLKRVDQKLQATSLVLSAGLSSTAPDLTEYKNKKLNGGNIPDGNLELFQTINILEQQKIYTDVSLKAYTSKDPIAVQQNALARVYTRINTLQAEIAALKSLQ